MLESTRLMTAVTAAAMLAACSGGGNDNGTTQPTPAIGIALSAATVSVTQGANNTVTVNLTRSGGFAGDVTVTVEGLPTGVTSAVSPSPIGSAASSAVITLTAAATATAATTNLTVRATGTGVTAQTATLALTVAAAPAPTYSLALGSATISVAQGASNNTETVTLTRSNGFAGAVALTAEGLPTGVTAAFNPQSTTANTSTLTLTAAANATVGTATITVRGTATGQTDKTATFQLTVTATVASGYTLSLAPATLTVQQGTNGTTTVNIARTGGFAGTVNLAATNLPNGVTAAFNPAAATANTSTLTLTATATATTGTVNVTITGTATGLTDQTVTLALTVTAPAGSYTLTMTPTTLNVAQGASSTATVNINRTGGFNGVVNLTASGLPNGVTASFNPAAASGALALANSSILTLTASATATTGPATVTIKGTSTGLADQTTTIAVTVQAATGGSGNTTYEFCRASATPIWFAVQDGAPNGTWTRVNPTGTKFQFNITQAKGAIAYVTSTASASVANASLASRLATSVQKELLQRNRPTRAYAVSAAVEAFSIIIVYGTQAELNSQGTSSCLPGSGKTVNGTVAGVSAASGQTATVSLGPSSAGVSNGSYTLKNVPDGALDMIATRSTVDLTTFTFATDKLIIRRGVNAADNSTQPVLDFGSTEAFDPVRPNLTINNLGTDVAAPFTFYFTSAGSSASGASLGFSSPTAAPFKYTGVPAAKQATGDVHLLFVEAFPSATSTDQGRIAGLYFKDATDRTVTLGPALTAPTVSVAATSPYVRFRATAALQSQYNQFLSLSFSQANASISRSVSITATQGYLSGMANYDFTLPDWTGVAGFDSNWGPKTGIATTWTVIADAYTGTGFGTGNPLDGATFTAATRNGTITP